MAGPRNADATHRQPWSADDRRQAVDRLMRFSSRAECTWQVEAAERAVSPEFLDWLDAAEHRALERSVPLACSRALYACVDHCSYDGETVIARFLAGGWAPPRERAYLAALAAAERRVFWARRRPDGTIELRDLWSGRRPTLPASVLDPDLPVPPLLAARLVRDGRRPLEGDVLPFPRVWHGRLLRIGQRTDGPDPDGRYAREHVARGILLEWYRLFDDVLYLCARKPGFRAAHRATLRVAADEGLRQLVFPAAGFLRLAGSYWCEAGSARPEASLLALVRRRGRVILTSVDEATLREALRRLQRCAGRRLLLEGVEVLHDPDWEEWEEIRRED